eukprot:Sspe_Gene.91448::Locus_62935_Transcript_1_1_Confidence_1.000_Length_934::g.91448::m.91448
MQVSKLRQRVLREVVTGSQLAGEMRHYKLKDHDGSMRRNLLNLIGGQVPLCSISHDDATAIIRSGRDLMSPEILKKLSGIVLTEKRVGKGVAVRVVAEACAVLRVADSSLLMSIGRKIQDSWKFVDPVHFSYTVIALSTVSVSLADSRALSWSLRAMQGGQYKVPQHTLVRGLELLSRASPQELRALSTVYLDLLRIQGCLALLEPCQIASVFKSLGSITTVLKNKRECYEHIRGFAAELWRILESPELLERFTGGELAKVLGTVVHLGISVETGPVFARAAEVAVQHPCMQPSEAALVLISSFRI